MDDEDEREHCEQLAIRNTAPDGTPLPAGALGRHGLEALLLRERAAALREGESAGFARGANAEKRAAVVMEELALRLQGDVRALQSSHERLTAAARDFRHTTSTEADAELEAALADSSETASYSQCQDCQDTGVDQTMGVACMSCERGKAVFARQNLLKGEGGGE